MSIYKKIKSFLLILLLLTPFLMCGCATIYNPATGRQEFIFISTTDEILIGKRVASQVRQQYNIYSEPQANQLIQSVGRDIAKVSDRQDIPYHFIILNDDEINAFTIPGGGVYVFKGLIDTIDCEDELAGVLSHEIGHIAARHIVKKMQAQMGYEILLSLASRGKEEYETTIKFANTAFNLVMLGYSREDEYMADTLGVRYMKRAGYNPAAMVAFLTKLKEKEKSRPIKFLSSHPGIDERIMHIKEEINKSQSDGR